MKHRAIAVVGDARETIAELSTAVKGYKADSAWTLRVAKEYAVWIDTLNKLQMSTNAPVPTEGLQGEATLPR